MKLFWNYNSSFFTQEKGYPLTVESDYQPPDTYLTIPSRATTRGFFFQFCEVCDGSLDSGPVMVGTEI
jgi:hypothetical protein